LLIDGVKDQATGFAVAKRIDANADACQDGFRRNPASDWIEPQANAAAIASARFKVSFAAFHVFMGNR
jgi:hypothetical protein